LLLTANRFQNVAGTRNIRQIDLGLNFIRLGPARARGLARRLRLVRGAKVRTHLVSLKVFYGTGMCFLFGHANCSQRVENSSAFNFQLSSQIVDSNLTHPPFLSSGLSR
jgi:hypothetical protein